MKKLFFVFIFLGLIFTLVGCSAVDTVEGRLEKEGYYIEKMDVESVSDFESEKEMLTFLEEIEVSKDEYEKHIYKNLYMWSSIEELYKIFRGE